MQALETPAGVKASSPFVVMAKPVGSRCNLQCSYCYYLETELPDPDGGAARMSDELLERFVRQYIEASPGPVVSFTWHGGEPTLAGLDFYRRAVELQQRYLPQGWSCWNNLQTNGVLLDDAWCDFLSGNRFDVGLSVDGTDWLHDSVRRDRGGNGSYERAVAAVRRLQARGLQPDLLCTVSAATAREAQAVYRSLRNLGTGWIQFIPIVRIGEDGQPTEDSVSGESYGRFLCDVFDEWVLQDLGRVEVQLFAEMQLVWSGGEASLCWMAPTCGRAVILERDGGVYSCDHFVTAEHRLGEIGGGHLGRLVDGDEQLRFGRDKRDRLPGRCRGCSWLAVCNGGCPKDRVATGTGEPGLNLLCDGLRRFFAHAEPSLKRVIELRARGADPAAIMAELRREALARWEGVGRNDPCPCGSGRKAKQCCWSKRP